MYVLTHVYIHIMCKPPLMARHAAVFLAEPAEDFLHVSEAADICDAHSQKHNAKQQLIGTARCNGLAKWLGDKKVDVLSRTWLQHALRRD